MLAFLRFLIKTKYYWLVSVFGLILAMLVTVVIASFVLAELSYDRWLPEHARTYRAQMSLQPPGSPTIELAGAAKPLRNVLQNNLGAELEAITYFELSPGSVRLGEVSVDQSLVLADGDFFKVFALTPLASQGADAFANPNSVALSASTARKLFGQDPPLGQQMLINSTFSAVVTMVFADFPRQSHFRPELVLHSPLPDAASYSINDWTSVSGYVYYKLKSAAAADLATAEQLPQRFPALIDANVPPIPGMDVAASNLFAVKAVPLSDIHTRSQAAGEITPPANAFMLLGLAVLGGLVLALALANFILVSTVSANLRARQAAIRRCLGETRLAAFARSYTENLALSLFASLIALALAGWTLPWISTLIGSSLAFTPVLSGTMLLVALALSVLVASLVSVSAAVRHWRNSPLLMLNSANPAQRGARAWWGYAIAALNLVLVVALLTFTFIVLAQYRFMTSTQNQQLALHEITLMQDVSRITGLGENLPELLRDALKDQPGVLAVAGVSDYPGNAISQRISLQRNGEQSDRQLLGNLLAVDEFFPQLVKAQLLAGRWFDLQYSGDTFTVGLEPLALAGTTIINATAAAALGFSNPQAAIGEQLILPVDQENYRFEVIGVTEDFHWQSYHSKINPIALVHWPEDINHLLILGRESPDAEFFAAIDQWLRLRIPAWVAVEKNTPKLALAQFWQQQYRSEQVLLRLLKLSSWVALLLALSGIVILALHNAQRQARSQAIRRILGEPQWTALGLTLQPYLIICALCLASAFPLVLWLQSWWLEQFAYRTRFGLGSSLLLIAIVLALVLVAALLQFFLARRRSAAHVLRVD